MGLTIGDYRGVKEVGHSGSTAGYRAHLVRYPDQHVSVAVLCNVSSGGATQAAQAVSDIYLAGHVKPAAAGGRGRGRGGAGQKTPAPVLTAEQLAAYAGTYVSDEAETTFTVVADGSGLTLKRRPDVSIPLTATGPDTFDARFAAMRFIRDADGRVTELSVAGSRVFDMRFKKQ
jgi:hypothetical protein